MRLVDTWGAYALGRFGRGFRTFDRISVWYLQRIMELAIQMSGIGLPRIEGLHSLYGECGLYYSASRSSLVLIYEADRMRTSERLETLEARA